MKKIMFKDELGLTQAVIEGHKTMTRRFVKELTNWPYKKDPQIVYDCNDNEFLAFRNNDDFAPSILLSQWRIGEVLAVAQSYEDIFLTNKHWLEEECAANEFYVDYLRDEAGWKNKMFTKTYYLPHKIRITDIKVERLQSISDDDCIREGIKKGAYMEPEDVLYYFTSPSHPQSFITPKEAFASLIDKVTGKGTWKKNPYVFAYSFELIK